MKEFISKLNLKLSKTKVIKKDLPGFPDEIIENWLLPLSKEKGWPPKDVYDESWIGVFRNKPFSFWKSLTWNKQKLSLTRVEDFIMKDAEIIAQLIIAHTYDVETPIASDTRNSKKRFDYLVEYFKKNKSFSWPICIVKENCSYMIADGCHRLAAYFYLLGIDSNYTMSTEQIYWLGKQ